MRISLIIILIILTLFCCSKNQPPQHYTLISNMMSQFVTKIEKKYPLICIGTGGEFFNQINSVYFSFDTPGPVSKEKMKLLMIEIVEEFLQMVNNDIEIRNYLLNYPFTEKNLNFNITAVDPSNKNLTIKNIGNSKEKLSHLYLRQGKLCYYILNQEKVSSQLIFEENFVRKNQH